MSRVVAKRYAQALIDVAADADAVDTVGEQLDQFSALLDRHDGLLAATLCSPVFTSEERRAVLDQLLPGLGFHPLVVNLLRLANDKKRFPIVDEISRAYSEFADARAGRERVTVRTAEPMSPQIEAEVRTALQTSTGKTVVLTTEVDPSLIGGMIAQVGGTVYDSSIRTRLQNIKQALLSSQVPGQA